MEGDVEGGGGRGSPPGAPAALVFNAVELGRRVLPSRTITCYVRTVKICRRRGWWGVGGGRGRPNISM